MTFFVHLGHSFRSCRNSAINELICVLVCVLPSSQQWCCGGPNGLCPVSNSQTTVRCVCTHTSHRQGKFLNQLPIFSRLLQENRTCSSLS